MYKNIKGKHGLSVTLHDGKTKTYDQLFDEFIYSTGRKLRVGCEGSWDLKMSHLSHMSIEFDAVGGSSFAFGHLSCAKLSLGVTYEKPISKYDVLKPYAELYVTYINIHGDIEEEWLKVPLGVFIVDEVKSGYLSKEITAYDYAYWYDAGDMTDFPNYNAKGGTDNNSFYFNNTKDGDNNIANTTLETVINYINNSSDFAAIKARTNNSGKIIDMDSNLLGLSNYKSLKLFDLGDNFTLRGFIGYLAGLRGRNAIFNRDGELEFRPINGNSLKTYKRSQYGSFSEDDTPMITNKLTSQYMIMKTNTDDDGNKSDELTTNTISYTPGFDKINEYAFVNPLITSETQLNHVYNAIKTTGRDDNYYIPCKLSMIGDPRLDINDIITVIRRKKNTDGTRTDSPIDIPIMKMKMKLNGGCSLEIESIADSTNGQTGGLTGSISKTLEKTTSMTKGMFNELYGVDGTFGTLFANEGKIGTFIAGKITASSAEIEKIIADDLKAGNLEVNAAKITNLKADKIEGGMLDASKVNIKGQSTGIELNITGTTITMKTPHANDSGEVVTRVLIGKDSDNSDKYVFRIRDALGNLIWDNDTITASAIVSGQNNSNVNSVIDIPSLVTSINTDSNTDTQFLAKTIDYQTGVNPDSGIATYKDLQTYLEELDEGNTIIIGNAGKLEKRVENLETVTGGHTTTINEHSKSIETINTDLSNKTNLLGELNSTVSNQGVSISNLTTTVRGHTESIAGIESMKLNYNEVINAINKSPETEKINPDRLYLKYNTSVVREDNISYSLDNYILSLMPTDSITGLTTRITASEESIDSLETSITNLETKLNQKANINSLVADVNYSADYNGGGMRERIIPKKVLLSPNMAIMTTNADNMILEDGDTTLESYIDSRVQAKITELENTITQLTNRIAVLESYHTTSEPEEPDNPEQTE